MPAKLTPQQPVALEPREFLGLECENVCGSGPHTLTCETQAVAVVWTHRDGPEVLCLGCALAALTRRAPGILLAIETDVRLLVVADNATQARDFARVVGLPYVYASKRGDVESCHGFRVVRIAERTVRPAINAAIASAVARGNLIDEAKRDEK